MPKLPVISGAKAVRAFERAGWRIYRQRSSHIIMLKVGFNVSLSVPQHRELAPGSLIRASALNVEEFVQLLY